MKITEDAAHPLKFLDWSIDEDQFEELVEMMSLDRPQRFTSLRFCGGIAVQTPWSALPKIVNQLSDLRKQSSISFVYGYFNPRKREIVLFPETIFEIVCADMKVSAHQLHRYSDEVQEQVLERFERQFYPMLVEEIEHGFQKVSQTKHRSILSKLVAFSSPLMPIYLLSSIIYIEFTARSYWWLTGVFAFWMLWIFLPVWVPALPKPRWLKRLLYTFNSLEKDAKGQAVSIRQFRAAKASLNLKLKKNL